MPPPFLPPASLHSLPRGEGRGSRLAAAGEWERGGGQGTCRVGEECVRGSREGSQVTLRITDQRAPTPPEPRSDCWLRGQGSGEVTGYQGEMEPWILVRMGGH